MNPGAPNNEVEDPPLGLVDGAVLSVDVGCFGNTDCGELFDLCFLTLAEERSIVNRLIIIALRVTGLAADRTTFKGSSF